MPEEVKDAILNQRDFKGNPLPSGAISTTEIEVLDLISEGPIEGLVVGEYTFTGVLGETGWRKATFTPYEIAPNTDEEDDIRWLRSVYWNEVPVVSSNNQYNYQRVDVSFAKGTPNGSLLGQAEPELTISRTIGERLRGSEIQLNTSTQDIKTDNTKYYRILNPDARGVIVNVRFNQLSRTILEGDRIGETDPSFVEYRVFYRPIVKKTTDDINFFHLGKSEIVEGTLSYGYIKSTRVDFFPGDYQKRDILGWEVKVVRTTPDSTSSHLRNQTFIDSLTEIYSDVFTYPNSAIVRQKFEAEFFQNVPDRAFDTNLLKVKIPANYDPITKNYRTNGPGTTNNAWDGTFDNNDQWTDNPAWCFYNLITNRRYGLGKYIGLDNVDKWTLYKIGQYCDVLVGDGFGGLEPRFTCNVIINSREEAYKLVNEFASIFRGIVYYANGSIFTIQDSSKSPVVTFVNANVEDGNFNYSSSSKRVRHTVAIVRFNDKNNFYKPTIEYVEDLDGIRKYGIRELELNAIGVTSRGQAIRFGRWSLLSEVDETETINFVAGYEANFLKPGDVFKVFDHNKKNKRHGGRVWKIENLDTNPQITLDAEVALNTGTIYNFSLLTPGFFYDPTNVSDLNSDDFGAIRKSQIQTLSFTGFQASGVNDRTNITFYNKFDTTNYNVTGQPVWTIELASSIANLTESNEFVDPDFDYYRVIGIEEQEENRYSVAGLQYVDRKYAEIESGVSFERSFESYAITPAPPDDLQLTLNEPTEHTQTVNYSFTLPDYSGVTSYRVYTKKDNFTIGEDNIPDDSFLVASLPVEITNETYIPAETGKYFFRVYSVNDEASLASTTYASGDIDVNSVFPIQDITISSLQLDTGLALNAAGFRNTGNYTIPSPTFTWQVGVDTDSSVASNFQYRLTVREPSENNTPSSNILFQATGLTLFPNDLTYTFDIDDNIALSGGPYRNYDVVVEAQDRAGKTSAGNTIDPLNEVWANSDGYDILSVNNAKVSGVFLSTGDNIITSGYQTEQWLDVNGGVYIIFNSGHLISDIVGGFIYSSTGIFDKLEAVTGGVPYPIKTGEFEFDLRSKLAYSPALLIDEPSGYIALSLFDSFDDALKDKGISINSGLYITNTTKIAPFIVNKTDAVNGENVIVNSIV